MQAQAQVSILKRATKSNRCRNTCSASARTASAAGRCTSTSRSWARARATRTWCSRSTCSARCQPVLRPLLHAAQLRRDLRAAGQPHLPRSRPRSAASRCCSTTIRCSIWSMTANRSSPPPTTSTTPCRQFQALVELLLADPAPSAECAGDAGDARAGAGGIERRAARSRPATPPSSTLSPRSISPASCASSRPA